MVIRVFNQPPPPRPEDTITKLIGHFGKWQLIVFSTVFLIKLSSGWVQMAILFLTPASTFQCVEFSGNRTSDVEGSKCYSDCVLYAHDTTPFISTIVSEWDLICERRWMASFTQMMLQLGVLLGSIIFGFLSDRFGRKNTFLASVTAMVILEFAIPFSPSYWIFTGLRFFLGIATAGTMVISFVLLIEVTSPKYRELLGCLYHIPFVVGHMTIPLFAYYFTSWQSYSLSLVVPQLIYVMYFFFLPESPRWLASMGRVEEATKIVKRAAEMNKLPTSNVEETLAKFSADLISKSEESKPNYSDLFRKSLRIRTLVICFIWLSTGLMYFGFNQYISQTSSNPFISTAAAGVIQFVGGGCTLMMLLVEAKHVSVEHVVWITVWGLVLVYCLKIRGRKGAVSTRTHTSLASRGFGVAELAKLLVILVIPAICLSIWLIKKFGRKAVLATSFCLGGICVITLSMIPQVFWMTFTLGTIGVSFASIVATVVYVYTSELYPTVVRNMGLGASSMSMRMGSMLAPFVSNLSTPWLPTAIIGSMQLIAGLTCLLLPETKGVTLSDSFNDVSEEKKEKP